MTEQDSFIESLTRARTYGLDEFLEIIGEIAQQSSRKGALERKEKELVTLGMALAKNCSRCIGIHSKSAADLGASPQEITQVQKIALFLNASPAGDSLLWKPWMDSWRDFVIIHGPIDHAHRELIALGISLIRQSREHIYLHAQAALEHGASNNQVFEVLPLALLMDGAPAISQIPHLMEALDNGPRKN
jgi:AhpD family alkylhydroperoxidase